MKYLLVIFGLFLTTALSGQKEAISSFEEKLKLTQVYFSQPLETFFKTSKIEKNSIITFDHALRGKQDPVDIRYKIIPVPPESSIALSPQMKINSLAIQVATNEEGASDMVFHRMPDEDIQRYNADYGITVFFQPKDKISNRKHCKAIFLYAEDKGIICIFLFFDKTDIDLQPYEQNMSFVAGSM